MHPPHRPARKGDAGSDPNEAVAFWLRMRELGRNGGPHAFLATHPSSDRRIEERRDPLPEAKRGQAGCRRRTRAEIGAGRCGQRHAGQGTAAHIN